MSSINQVNFSQRHEFWIDYTKFFACALVALGHLFQSFSKTGLIDSSNELFINFNTIIYLFHVPVFFFCSGYLYQKTTIIDSLQEYKKNVGKKILNLGIPYLTFSIITLVLKNIFSSSIATPQNFGFFDTLFLHPVSPYWFLYTLLFLFIFIPTVNSRKSLFWLLAIALCLKALIIVPSFSGLKLPFVISSVMVNMIWFVLGMACQFKKWVKYVSWKIVFISCLFIPVSIMITNCKINFLWLLSFFTLWGIFMSVSIFYKTSLLKMFPHRIMTYFSKYTLQIFVLHTICAASLRSLLFKLEIRSFSVHLIVGIIASFLIPIIIACIAEKSIYLNFFFQPLKSVKKTF